jgi:hypothetical protein
MIKVGWQYYQTYSTETYGGYAVKYWDLQFQPYARVYAFIQSILDIKNFFYSDFTINLNSFLAYLFLDIRFYWNSYVCFSCGISIQQVILNLLLALEFMNCYKMVLDSFPFCLLTYWQGNTAKYLDSCSFSDSESVSIYTWNPVKTTQTTYYYGGSTITSPGCVKVISAVTNPIQQHALDLLYGYLDVYINEEWGAGAENEGEDEGEDEK